MAAPNKIEKLFAALEKSMLKSILSGKALGMSMQELQLHCEVDLDLGLRDFERVMGEDDEEVAGVLMLAYSSYRRGMIRGAMTMLSVAGEQGIEQNGQLYRATIFGRNNLGRVNTSQPYTPVVLWPLSDEVFFRAEQVKP